MTTRSSLLTQPSSRPRPFTLAALALTAIALMLIAAPSRADAQARKTSCTQATHAKHGTHTCATSRHERHETKTGHGKHTRKHDTANGAGPSLIAEGEAEIPEAETPEAACAGSAGASAPVDVEATICPDTPEAACEEGAGVASDDSTLMCEAGASGADEARAGAAETESWSWL
jgi:hypothetical protein